MTRLIPFAILAVLGSATLASAENSFASIDMRQSRDDMVELGTVTTDGPGKVLVYDFKDDKVGTLLGSAELMSGANTDVKVPVTVAATDNAIALLVVDGKLVGAEPIQFTAP